MARWLTKAWSSCAVYTLAHHSITKMALRSHDMKRLAQPAPVCVRYVLTLSRNDDLASCLMPSASVIPHTEDHTLRHHERFCSPPNLGSTACFASIRHRNHTSTAARPYHMHGPGVPFAVDALPQALQKVSTYMRAAVCTSSACLNSAYPVPHPQGACSISSSPSSSQLVCRPLGPPSSCSSRHGNAVLGSIKPAKPRGWSPGWCRGLWG